jgi:hypothetical protein
LKGSHAHDAWGSDAERKKGKEILRKGLHV